MEVMSIIYFRDRWNFVVFVYIKLDCFEFYINGINEYFNICFVINSGFVLLVNVNFFFYNILNFIYVSYV